jgi:glutamyl-Q tRNA(Asp) synthetase
MHPKNTGFKSYLCRNLPRFKFDFADQAIRLKVTDQQICFEDRLQGQLCSNLKYDLGDFVLKRRDGIISYQFAVVVDDYLQGITHVVRGADLLDNTVRQIWLGSLLNYPSLNYMHLPLAMNDQGQKLSKQNLAQALDINQAPELLQQAILALGQSAIELDQPRIMLQQAVQQWDINRILKAFISQVLIYNKKPCIDRAFIRNPRNSILLSQGLILELKHQFSELN